MNGATFSPDRKYRYTLRRSWIMAGEHGAKTVAFIGLNPSTADENVDDPTIRRCIGFARRWGYGHLLMLNIFALRSTDPQELYRTGDFMKAIGPDNRSALIEGHQEAHLTVAAWGVHGELYSRGFEVKTCLQHHRQLWNLGLTKGGSPKHPLYLRADTPAVPW